MELDYKAIGKRIKVARIRADMSQEKLAEMCDISATHMSNIETGRTKLSLPVLVTVANALNVSADELLCDSVVRSFEVFSKEIQNTLSDCSEQELRLMEGILKVVKETVRKKK